MLNKNGQWKIADIDQATPDVTRPRPRVWTEHAPCGFAQSGERADTQKITAVNLSYKQKQWLLASRPEGIPTVPILIWPRAGSELKPGKR